MADTPAINALNVPATLSTGSNDLVVTGGTIGTVQAARAFGQQALKVETTSGGIRVVFQ